MARITHREAASLGFEVVTVKDPDALARARSEQEVADALAEVDPRVRAIAAALVTAAAPGAAIRWAAQERAREERADA